MDWQAIVLSIRLASWTTSILVVFGLPLSYWLSISHSKAKSLIEAVVSLPLILPPTVLGFYILNLSGPKSPLGAFYHSVFGHSLPFSFAGLLLGSVIYSLPFAIQPFVAGFQKVDRTLLEASWCLGVSKWDTILRVVVPLSFPSILSGIILCFSHTLGEFGVVLMMGGNIEGVTRTLSLSVFDDLQMLNYSGASQTSALLLGVSFIALIALSFLRKRAVTPW